jgi:hypothetical protein
LGSRTILGGTRILDINTDKQNILRCRYLWTSNGTSITEKSVTQNQVLFTSRQTEYSLMQVPLHVVRHQMAPASVTILLYQNCMLFASRQNRI